MEVPVKSYCVKDTNFTAQKNYAGDDLGDDYWICGEKVFETSFLVRIKVFFFSS